MTLVQTVGVTQAGDPSSLTSPSLTVQAGDVLIAWLSTDYTQAVTISSSGDSWTVVQSVYLDTNCMITTGYCLSATSGTKTVSATGLGNSYGNDVTLVVQQFRPASGATVTLDYGPIPTAMAWGNGGSSSAFSTTGPGIISSYMAMAGSLTSPTVTATIAGTSATIGFSSSNSQGGIGQAYAAAIESGSAQTSQVATWTTTDTQNGQIGVIAIKEVASSTTVTPASISSGVALGQPGLYVPSTSGTSVFRASPGRLVGADVLVNEIRGGVKADISNGFWGPPGEPTVQPVSISLSVSVGSPAIGQNHVLVPTSISTAVSVGHPSLSLNASVTPNSISSAVSVAQPAIVSGTTVTPSPISSGVSVGTPTVQQAQQLTASPISSAVTVGTPSLQQNSAFTPNSISASVVNGTTSITQNHVLGAQSVTVSVTNGQPTVILAGAIQPVSISAAVGVGSPVLSQNQILAISSVSVGVSITNPTIRQNQVFSPDNLSISVLLGTPALSQSHLFTPVSISSAVLLGTPTVVPSGASPIYLCINGAWKIGDQYVAVGGQWYQAYQFNINVNHTWKS